MYGNCWLLTGLIISAPEVHFMAFSEYGIV